MHRTYYWLEPNTDLSDEGKARFRRKMTEMVKYEELPSHECSFAECNLIGSKVQGSTVLHMPMFDVDDNSALSAMSLCFPTPATIWIPSMSANHWHLYLQCAMPWNACVVLLRYHMDCGTIDRKWAQACLDQGQMFLRKPIGTITGAQYFVP